jgi:hypothetical protein
LDKKELHLQPLLEFVQYVQPRYAVAEGLEIFGSHFAHLLPDPVTSGGYQSPAQNPQSARHSLEHSIRQSVLHLSKQSSK